MTREGDDLESALLLQDLEMSFRGAGVTVQSCKEDVAIPSVLCESARFTSRHQRLVDAPQARQGFGFDSQRRETLERKIRPFDESQSLWAIDQRQRFVPSPKAGNRERAHRGRKSHHRGFCSQGKLGRVCKGAVGFLEAS